MEYASIFSMWDTDLCTTSLVWPNIRVRNNTPFKQLYQYIPPTMYEEVSTHLKEMLEIGAIQPSSIGCGLAPSYQCKRRMENSQFCINLRKLNAHTIKKSYRLLRIEDTLDSLNGAVGSLHSTSSWAVGTLQ